MKEKVRKDYQTYCFGPIIGQHRAKHGNFKRTPACRRLASALSHFALQHAHATTYQQHQKHRMNREREVMNSRNFRLG